MFKKFIHLILILSAILLTPKSSFALYWGIFYDYEENKNNYAVVKFINNTPIKYAIVIDALNTNNTQVKNTNEEVLKQQLGSTLQQEQTLNNMIVEAFNIWPKDTLAAIRDKNNSREKEFADITPLLSRPKGVNLQKVAKNENPDIIFHFLNSKKRIKQFCTGGACIKKKHHPVDVYILNPYAVDIREFHSQKKYSLSSLIHEIGHYFALTDQYENYEDSDSDINHSTADRFYTRVSLMGSSHDTILTCDDVDGFINVIDLTWALTHNNKFTYRASNGWNSFCNGKKWPDGTPYTKTRYAKAKVVNQPVRAECGKDCVNVFDNEGNYIEEIVAPSLPFDFYNKKLTYNQNGLVDTKEDGAYIYKYNYIFQNSYNISSPSIEVLYYLKENYPYKGYSFKRISLLGTSPETNFKDFPIAGCNLGSGLSAGIIYAGDDIMYRTMSCDKDTTNSYIFNQKGKLLKREREFIIKDKKYNKKYWGIIKEQKSSGQTCTLYIEKNDKSVDSNIDTIAKEFNYDKTNLKKEIDKFCNRNDNGDVIKYLPTINYFIKVKKYFKIR